MKRIGIAIFCAIILMFSFQETPIQACGNKKNNPSTSPGGNPPCIPCEFGAGSPNNVQAGNHFRKETDINLPTRGFPLELTRSLRQQPECRWSFWLMAGPQTLT